MERGRLDVTSEYAPITYDGLVEAVGSLACDPNRECTQRYPFNDRHHLIFGEDLTEAERLLKSHPDFIVNVCRCVHQAIHNRYDRSEPVSDDFVIGYYIASPANMSKTRIKNLKKLRRSTG